MTILKAMLSTAVSWTLPPFLAYSSTFLLSFFFSICFFSKPLILTTCCSTLEFSWFIYYGRPSGFCCWPAFFCFEFELNSSSASSLKHLHSLFCKNFLWSNLLNPPIAQQVLQSEIFSIFWRSQAGVVQSMPVVTVLKMAAKMTIIAKLTNESESFILILFFDGAIRNVINLMNYYRTIWLMRHLSLLCTLQLNSWYPFSVLILLMMDAMIQLR